MSVCVCIHTHKQVPFDGCQGENVTVSCGEQYSKIQAINPAAGSTLSLLPAQPDTTSLDAGRCRIVQKWRAGATASDKAVSKWHIHGTYGSSEFTSLRMAELEESKGLGRLPAYCRKA